MNVLLIGGTGFIGFQVLLDLLKKGYKVRVLAKPGSGKPDHFPEYVNLVHKDIYKLSDKRYLSLLENTDAVIFAAGVDDRFLPDKPAWDFFHKGNVESTVRLVHFAKKKGISRIVVTGSYFAHFAREWPEMNLINRHPYIRSRIDQITKACEEAEGKINLSFIELPFIFGATTIGKPIWTPLLKYLKSFWPIFAPAGGTALVSIKTASSAIIGALESGRGVNKFVIGQQNMSWKELFTVLAKEQGRNRRIIHLPKALLHIALAFTRFFHSWRGKEGGLNFAKLADLLTKELYLDYRTVDDRLNELKYEKFDLTAAFQSTIRAAFQIIDNK
ncbi:MAG: NAD-dependent epimerase/dehydratase family protein [Bacteroidetes bacterium]|jgi:dihydroflavonol-4-reductase|nr:NAD-dependent epimerase/dehydratase family protein [Bacteroidota bacterium]MBT4402115.1 NAD-dependent epimerase/dehydratase family protein [Bacteroidota bacterium]MBT4409121.1 NAD-dependent epimerase/dehydratase family protein [Bacteroidota bacterium]MBT7094319.1 NAD-dependent epimerase/dehydratase family protein [Bacteroidota bacterium]MBT7462663.1 NAD-dependent epimerase/dehydratase family protein [Bacteroidota bacterium]